MGNKKNTITKKTPTSNYLMGAFSDLPFGLKEPEDKYNRFIVLNMIKDILDDSKGFRSITAWCLHVGLYPKDLEILCDRDETVKRAYEVCLAKIGERRENEVLKGAPAVMATILPQFNKVWRTERDERAAMRANLEGKGTVNMTVNIPALPKIEGKE